MVYCHSSIHLSLPARVPGMHSRIACSPRSVTLMGALPLLGGSPATAVPSNAPPTIGVRVSGMDCAWRSSPVASRT
eukprot:11695134-Alexandrium_andersonii.AAC.1